MKQDRILLAGILVVLALVFFLTSCDEEAKFTDPDALNAAVDETTLVENTFASISSDVEEAIYFKSLPNGRHGFGFGGCATRTEEQPEGTDYPLVITLDYGEDCTFFGDFSKSGKVIITLTGDPSEVGAQKILTFENFVVNGYQIEGTRTYTRTGSNSYIVSLEGGRITTPEGAVITRTSSRIKEQISGQDTEDRSDDAYEITGSASGVNSEGQSYSKTISIPLVVTGDCLWITSGVIESVVEGGSSVSIDFGDGTCDDLAIRTEDGVSEEITMNFRARRFKGRG